MGLCMRVHLSPYFVLANSDNSGEQTRLSIRFLYFHFRDLVPSCTEIRKQNTGSFHSRAKEPGVYVLISRR